MNTTRANLNKLGKKPPYLLLSLILIILSAVAIYFFYFNIRSGVKPPLNPPTAEGTPLEPTASIGATPDSFYPLIPTSPASTASPSLIPFLTEDTPAVSASPSGLPPPSPTPIPDYQTFSSPTDTFTVEYSSSRTLYEDKNGSINRYTFYSPAGSIAVHVGPDWSWQHPGREFTPIFKIDGQNTFRYDINLQTIVDIQKDGNKYTIQCVHNTKEELKSDCNRFFSTFRIL